MKAASLAPSSDLRLDSRKVVNVVIMKDLNFACHEVQIQTMEVGAGLVHKVRLLIDSAAGPKTPNFQQNNGAFGFGGLSYDRAHIHLFQGNPPKQASGLCPSFPTTFERR